MEPTRGNSKVSRIAEQMTSASRLATDEIRVMIQRGTLEPDRKVSIEELSEELGVSRTPVREAVQRLELEGLVEIIPRVGVRVRTITTEEASDVYSLKRAVEPLAARWATVRSPESVRARLTPLMEEMEAACEAGDVGTYAQLVEAFHTTLIELARAPALEDMWSVVSSRVHRLRHLNLSRPGRLATSFGHHRRIADAMFSGDGDLAFREMADHMSNAHEAALQAVAQVAEQS